MLGRMIFSRNGILLLIATGLVLYERIPDVVF